VILLGERPDVPALLKTADLFLFCSRTEGLPNAVLEAMAAGLAVVATDIPGSRDLINDGKTGVLVEKGSVEAIRAATESLLEDSARRSALGLAAQKWVRENRDISVLVKKMIDRYETIALQRRQKCSCGTC